MRKITEGFLNKHDVQDVLKKAAEIKPVTKSWLGKKKGGLELSDLQKAWAAAGYPDDSRKIAQVLKSLGYERKEINKVFRDTFDTKYGAHDTGNSGIVTQLAKYIKDNGYAEEIAAFLEHQYDIEEAYAYEGKVVVEQVRTVFERIIREERLGLPRMQREFEQQSLGRQRK
jgi:hypothetical protein